MVWGSRLNSAPDGMRLVRRKAREGYEWQGSACWDIERTKSRGTVSSWLATVCWGLGLAQLSLMPAELYPACGLSGGLDSG